MEVIDRNQRLVGQLSTVTTLLLIPVINETENSRWPLTDLPSARSAPTKPPAPPLIFCPPPALTGQFSDEQLESCLSNPVVQAPEVNFGLPEVAEVSPLVRLDEPPDPTPPIPPTYDIISSQQPPIPLPPALPPISKRGVSRTLRRPSVRLSSPVNYKPETQLVATQIIINDDKSWWNLKQILSDEEALIVAKTVSGQDNLKLVRKSDISQLELGTGRVFEFATVGRSGADRIKFIAGIIFGLLLITGIITALTQPDIFDGKWAQALIDYSYLLSFGPGVGVIVWLLFSSGFLGMHCRRLF